MANIQKIPSSSPVTYSSGLTDEGGKKMLPHLPSPSMSAGPELWEMKSLSLTGGDAHWENCGELQFQEVIPGKADSCPSPIHHHTYPYIISPHKLFVDMGFFFCAKLHAHVKTFEVGLCLELLNACGLEIVSPRQTA